MARELSIQGHVAAKGALLDGGVFLIVVQGRTSSHQQSAKASRI